MFTWRLFWNNGCGNKTGRQNLLPFHYQLQTKLSAKMDVGNVVKWSSSLGGSHLSRDPVFEKRWLFRNALHHVLCILQVAAATSSSSEHEVQKRGQTSWNVKRDRRLRQRDGWKGNVRFIGHVRVQKLIPTASCQRIDCRFWHPASLVSGSTRATNQLCSGLDLIKNFLYDRNTFRLGERKQIFLRHWSCQNLTASQIFDTKDWVFGYPVNFKHLCFKLLRKKLVPVSFAKCVSFVGFSNLQVMVCAET